MHNIIDWTILRPPLQEALRIGISAYGARPVQLGTVRSQSLAVCTQTGLSSTSMQIDLQKPVAIGLIMYNYKEP